MSKFSNIHCDCDVCRELRKDTMIAALQATIAERDAEIERLTIEVGQLKCGMWKMKDAEITRLKTALSDRTAYHDNAQVEADLLVLADAVVEAHEHILESGSVECGVWWAEDGEDQTQCKCPTCQLARKVKGGKE